LADFSQIAGTQTVAVTDPLQPAKVQVTGLTPNTTYFYRAIDSSGASAAGRFNTSAPVGTRTGLRFGASGDWRGELSPYPAIANADDRNLEFFIELGDTVYADFPSPALNKPQAETLQEFRIKNNEVYAERFGINTWGDLRSATSILATIDDHEVINDFEGGELASADPRFNDTTPGRLINDTELYDNGLQAFQEYNPLRDDFYGAIGDSRMDGERKLYRYNTYGSDAATFVLDARSFRDEGLPAVANPGDPTQVVNFLGQSFNPSRTMLGRQQVSDLKRDLLQAEQAGISWKFVVVPEPIQNLGVVAASDRFEGYAAERTEILKFIDENDISNVVFIAADIHSTLVNNLTYQNGLGQPQIATSAFEITTGAVAFDAPFGPTVAELAAGLGLLPAAQKAFYDSLPVANDADSTPNDKDDFIKQLTNAQLTPLGYDPLGLNDNLAIANNKIDAKLLQGDYLSTHTYGWTEFDIDPVTQKLTVTTYGIPFYTEAELLADPGAIANRTPTIVSQFEVKPTLLGTKENDTIIAFQDSNDVVKAQDGNDDIFGLSGDDRLQGDEGNDNLSGGNGNDNLTGGSGRDLLVGGQGDDTLLGDNGRDELLGRAGNDTLRGGIGRDVIQGGRGADIFVLAIGEGRDTIADFDLEEGDRLGLADGLTFDQLTITQGQGSRTGDTLIRATGSNELLAIVLDVEASVLGRSVFTAV
jgi:phosphodiesterase/alkaline phosphatase D-like protein